MVIAKHLPGDKSIEYTSPWYVASGPNSLFRRCRVHCARESISDTFHRAGAHWRSHALEGDPEQQQWDIETYKHWLDVIEEEDRHTGHKLLSGLGVSQSASSCLLLSNSSFSILFDVLLTFAQLRKSSFYRWVSHQHHPPRTYAYSL